MRTLFVYRSGVSTVNVATQVFWVAVWLIALAFLSPRFVVGNETSQVWRTDFETALHEAEERKLPLLLHFHADWCMPCKRMEQTVFTSNSVKEMLSSRFVAAKLNSEKNLRLVQRYGIEILPADLIIDPVSGRVLTVHTGVMDQSQYLTMAQQSEISFQKLHVADSTKVVADAKVTSPQLGDPQPVVGLDGYSPVALMKSRKWVRGSAQFAWDHKGVIYYLDSRDELIEFRRTPEAYAPKLLGCDPVILWQTDRAVAGSVEFGAFYNGELYLFKTEERRKQFKASPDKFIHIQHVVKADQIEHTVLR